MARLRALVLLTLPLPFIVGFTLPGEVARLVDAGHALYASGKFKEAEERYDRAAALQPERPQLPFNRGAARYRQGKYEEALADFLQAAGGAQGQLKAFADYNAGNSLFRLQRFDEAIEAYKRALTLNPADQWAKWNLELAQRARDRQQQQQQREQKQEQSQRDQQPRHKQQPQGQQQPPREQQPQRGNAQPSQPRGPQPQSAQRQQAQQQPQSQPQEGRPLSREQAAQLLSALAREDADIQKIIRRAPMTPERPTDKDW